MKTMLYTRQQLRRTVLPLMLGLLSSQCTQQAATDPKADTPCQLQQIDSRSISTATGQPTTETTEQIRFEYDAAGKLTRRTEQRDDKPTGQAGSGFRSTKVDTYTYDNGGLLLAKNQTETWTEGSGTLTATARTDYTYTNGKLSRSTTQATNRRGLVTQTISLYTYDGGGLLNQRSDQITYPTIPTTLQERPVYPGGYTETWTYRSGIAVDFIRKAGNTETRPYTLLNGLVQRDAIGSGREVVYTYNTDKRLLKHDQRNAGKSEFTMEFTYATAKNSDPAELFSGFSAVQHPFGTTGLLATFTVYLPSYQTGALYKTTDQQNQYKQTAQGYVKTADETLTFFNEGASSSSSQVKTTRTYTYTGLCD
jgi:YD repeat-containing protein